MPRGARPELPGRRRAQHIAMRLALYAHYGERASVAEHVLYYLQQLQAFGFKICFVSNSPLSTESKRRLETMCARVYERENTGYDFSMWQHALAEFDLADVTELLLTNSSIVGPLQPLETVWRNPRVQDCDFWGLTDNADFTHHLQSYFLVFRRAVLESDAFTRFWDGVLPFTDKWLTILSYEVTLTGWLVQNGFSWRAMFPKEEVWRRYRSGLTLRQKIKDRLQNHWLPGYNTTLLYPEILLEMGMPFVKSSLVRRGSRRISPLQAYRLLEQRLPHKAVEEMRPAESAKYDTNTLDDPVPVGFPRRSILSSMRRLGASIER